MASYAFRPRPRYPVLIVRFGAHRAKRSQFSSWGAGMTHRCSEVGNANAAWVTLTKIAHNIIRWLAGPFGRMADPGARFVAPAHTEAVRARVRNCWMANRPSRLKDR